jgi:hypothetical protein
MAAKLTRLTHKIAIQLHRVAESCIFAVLSLQVASPETFLLCVYQKGLNAFLICGSNGQNRLCLLYTIW